MHINTLPQNVIPKHAWSTIPNMSFGGSACAHNCTHLQPPRPHNYSHIIVCVGHITCFASSILALYCFYADIGSCHCLFPILRAPLLLVFPISRNTCASWWYNSSNGHVWRSEKVSQVMLFISSRRFQYFFKNFFSLNLMTDTISFTIFKLQKSKNVYLMLFV